MSNSNVQFRTEFRYEDRERKAKYVWLKYQQILNGKLLDVGADECYLRRYLDLNTEYYGIGLGGSPDQQVDLETQTIPFPDASYDCVLCLDVLEHLDNPHEIFDELCRVSKKYVIISLPNPWADFFMMMRTGFYQDRRPMKFYGLPAEPPEDRHKWFFSYGEAEEFITLRAAKNGMHILQMDSYAFQQELGIIQRLAYRILFGTHMNPRDLYSGPLWAALEKAVS